MRHAHDRNGRSEKTRAPIHQSGRRILDDRFRAVIDLYLGRYWILEKLAIVPGGLLRRSRWSRPTIVVVVASGRRYRIVGDVVGGVGQQDAYNCQNGQRAEPDEDTDYDVTPQEHRHQRRTVHNDGGHNSW